MGGMQMATIEELAETYARRLLNANFDEKEAVARAILAEIKSLRYASPNNGPLTDRDKLAIAEAIEARTGGGMVFKSADNAALMHAINYLMINLQPAKPAQAGKPPSSQGSSGNSNQSGPTNPKPNR